jgi:hypothetical protein
MAVRSASVALPRPSWVTNPPRSSRPEPDPAGFDGLDEAVEKGVESGVVEIRRQSRADLEPQLAKVADVEFLAESSWHRAELRIGGPISGATPSGE